MSKLIKISQEYFDKLDTDITHKCKYCGKEIWYENTKVTFNKDGSLAYAMSGSNWRTKKKINGIVYPIHVCQYCLEDKYPDFKTKNVSKIFNTFNKFVSYAFDIPEDIINNVNKSSAITLENMIIKYGEEEGTKRFNQYKEKQAYSNSFEYKQNKHGWTKEEYDKFNKSRAVTLENLISKHGEEEGTKIWESYCERQSYTSTDEYLIEKFGEEEANNIKLCKSHNLKGFIAKYGEEEGKRKYDDYIKNTQYNKTYSESSLIFFNNLINEMKERNIIYGDIWYGEREKLQWSKNGDLYYFDFFIPELKLVIEFNGDYWHCNPNRYEPDYYHPHKKMTAEQIWMYDKIKQDVIEKEFGYNIITIWEKDVKKNENEIIKMIISEIIKIQKICINK